MRTLCKEEMWKAVVTCDSIYDGDFFYAVKSTGIFCRPSCKSRTPLKKNISFFHNAEEAFSKGFRPCKRCRPDLTCTTYNPQNEIVEEIKLLLENEFNYPWRLDEIAKQAGMSPYHLHRLFKKSTGVTPRQYLEELRIEKAKQLLRQGELSNSEICFATGFQSVPQFYSAFRYQTGCSPKEFQKKI